MNITKSKNNKVCITIELDSIDNEELKNQVNTALKLYRSCPKSKTNVALLEAFVHNSKLMDRWVVEEKVGEVKRFFNKAPSRPIIIEMRKLGLLDGTFIKEKGKGNHVNTFYQVDLLVQRLAKLSNANWTQQINTKKLEQQSQILLNGRK